MSNVAVRTIQPARPDKPVPERRGRPAERPIVLVVVLGHSLPELEAVVEQVALQQTVTPSVDPVFLTDQAESLLFQGHGWAFEYVMPYDEWCRFRDPHEWIQVLRRRVASMVEVFRPRALLQYTNGPARDLTGSLMLHAVAALEGPGAASGPAAERITDLERTVERLQDRIKELERNERNRRAAGQVRAIVTRLVPRDAVVLMVAKGDPALAAMPDVQIWPFPQGPGGEYAGYNPADSSEAIGHLEALRARGAEYLAFPTAYHWWLEHYDGFRAYLDRAYKRVLDHPQCIMYAVADRRDAPRA